jgi:dienelactone hydrolase
MKNLKYFILGILMYSTGSSAQLKAVAYKDGSQVLNGFKIAKKSKQKPGILILPAWHGIDKASKDIAGDLAALGYTIADIYGEGNYPKDNAEAGQKSSYYKTNYKEYQNEFH